MVTGTMGLMSLLSAAILGVSILLASPPPSDTAANPSRAPAALHNDVFQGSSLGPFAAASVIPDDVSLLIRVENAARLRRELQPRPISRALSSWLSDGSIERSWSSLASTLSVSQSELFDECFGRDVTYIARAKGEWVVMTHLRTDLVRGMLRQLGVRVLEPRFGLAVSELPEQEVLLASDGNQLIIGSSRHAQLFHDLLDRWGGDDSGAHSRRLSGSEDFRSRLTELDCRSSRANIAAFIRHQRPLGGCSMIVADVRNDDVSVRHSAKFDNPLFASPVTKLTCDFSPLNALAQRSLLAVMQPRDTGDGPIDAYLTAGLGAGLISAPMRQNLADRRLLVVGEADARQMPKAQDLLTTTFVAGLELKNLEGAAEQLDQQMGVVAERLNAIGQGAFLIRVPDGGDMPAFQPRQADLGEAEGWFTGGFPVMRTVSLNWAVAESPNGNWFLIGSHPDSLQDTIEALAAPAQHHARLVGRYDSCGVANGQRLGRHVESWREEAPKFTDGPDVNRVRSTLTTISAIAGGLEDIRWQMERPSPTALRLCIQAKLSSTQTIDR